MLELNIKLSPDGQITLPADVQTRLGVRGGDEIVFVIEGDEIRLRAPKPRKLSDFVGVLPPTKGQRAHRDMKEARQVVAKSGIFGDLMKSPVDFEGGKFLTRDEAHERSL